MKYIKYRALWISVLGLSTWFFSGPVAAAECLANNGVHTGTFVISSEIVTPYGGSALTCPDGYENGCTIEDVVDGATCDVVNPDGSASYIKIKLVDDFLTWKSYDVGPDEVVGTGDDTPNIIAQGEFGGLDAVFRKNGTGGNGCYWSYGADQVEASASFLKDNNTYMPTRSISFCLDDKQEFTAIPPPTRPEVKECVLLNGESKTIHGVDFVCDNVLPGEQRTIIIVKDTENCVEEPAGSNTYVCDKVPDFGFRDADNNIDFNNVCQCIGVPDPDTGSFPVLKVACDPDPEIEGECEIDAGAEMPAHITLQNEKCFTIGGRRKCF